MVGLSFLNQQPRLSHMSYDTEAAGRDSRRAWSTQFRIGGMRGYQFADNAGRDRQSIA